MRLKNAALAMLCLYGCAVARDDAAASSATKAATHAQPVAPAADRRVQAQALIARLECNRCHDGTGIAAAPRDRHCVQCHREIREGTFPAEPADLERWRKRARSMLVAPSLEHAGARLRREWIATFLLRPVDVRPHLPASMPRLPLSPEDAALIAEYLAPEEGSDVDLSAADAAEGARLYESRGCPSCHRDGSASEDAVALAPDLALTRERMQAGRLVEWLRDPAALAPGTLMPQTKFSEPEARDVAAFLVSAPVPAPHPVAPANRLPPLSRAVRWEEVAKRVFHKTCWHCHAAPHFARGDGGPGNSGGFGFAPRGLDLSSYAGAAAGSFGPDGKRRSVFAPLPDSDGTPRLLAHLLARAAEERGGVIEGVRGMPLGLPALPPEDIQLVESWIAQGRPE